MLAMISRLDHQKGIEIAIDALRLLTTSPWQFVLLGSGDPALEAKILALQEEFPDRVRAITRFDAPLSRMIYGSADLFLMPSLYEPCGLAQMIAMRYGCIPVVRATGGLKDTVHENRTGFLFSDPDPVSMSEAIVRALAAFSDAQTWRAIQRNAMAEDFSWSNSALQYARIYRSLLSSE